MHSRWPAVSQANLPGLSAMRPSELATPDTLPFAAAAVAAIWCFIVVFGAMWSAPASADIVHMPQTSAHSTAAVSPASLPQRDQTMADVRKAFGKPLKTHPTVGGHAPRRPPITRWDYPGFSVVFERNKVINTVVPGDPPKVFHAQQLQR